MPDILTEECPFCKTKNIKVIHREETFSAKVTRINAGRSTKMIKNPESYEVISNKCPNCGKSKKEIENALKHGKEPTNDEIIRRMKEAGLPLKIKG